eukprot:UN22748
MTFQTFLFCHWILFKHLCRFIYIFCFFFLFFMSSIVIQDNT